MPEPTRKNVLLLFSKLPKQGLVKTRLTYLKDGIFSPEDACRLYEAMLLDVVDVCIASFAKLIEMAPSGRLKDDYQLMVSCAPEEDVPMMEKLLESANGNVARLSASLGNRMLPIKVICDSGESFDAHYNDAFDKTWADGADCILSMGADMPALRMADVIAGFEALHDLDAAGRLGIVLSPDQDMGVSIIGWNKECQFDHSGIFYSQDGLTVLPAYIRKAKDHGIDAVLTPPVPDVDSMRDLMHSATLVEALSYCAECGSEIAPKRTAKMLEELEFADIRVMPNGLFDPRGHIDA